MLVFSVVVLFQSCAAGLVNTVENNGNTDGSTGFMIFLVMIIFGMHCHEENTFPYNAFSTGNNCRFDILVLRIYI